MRLLITILFVFFISAVYADEIYRNPPSEEGAWPFTFDTPACDDAYVLRKIMHDFEKRERDFWNSDLFIARFEIIKETGLRSHGLSYTPRRYCKSTAIFGDGAKRDVFYNITPDQSIIFSGQVIDWCVVGLDRAHVDGPNCRRVTSE